MRPVSIKPTSLDVVRHATSAESSVTHHRSPPSPWNTPVPYLFGGLAIMLGLIAIALIILAYSYWRLATSGEDSGEGNGGRGDEEKESRLGEKTADAAYEEKILVIMAGDDLPRFLATPAAKKCVCGDHKGKMVISKEDGHGGDGDGGGEDVRENEKVKENEETTSH